MFFVLRMPKKPVLKWTYLESYRSIKHIGKPCKIFETKIKIGNYWIRNDEQRASRQSYSMFWMCHSRETNKRSKWLSFHLRIFVLRKIQLKFLFSAQKHQQWSLIKSIRAQYTQRVLMNWKRTNEEEKKRKNNRYPWHHGSLQPIHIRQFRILATKSKHRRWLAKRIYILWKK